jgi:tetratricopeptide (TPR) repeat protein
MRVSRGLNKLLLSLSCLLLIGGWMTPAQTSPPPPLQPAKTWAVIIGISNYPRLGGGQQLKFSENDAQAFSQAIKKAGATDETIRLLTNQRATVVAIKDAIGNWLAQAAYEDTVYIYFSGHGVVEKNFNESYLLAYDSDTSSPYSSALSLTEVSYALSRRIKARRVLVIGDAVREDFFKSDEVGKANSVTFSKTFLQLSEWRAGISVMLANGEGEYSREGQRWESHGVFTKHLLDAIVSGADINQDGLTSSEEAFEFISSRVAKDTSKKQNPTRSGITLAQIEFSKRGASPSSPQISTPSAGAPPRHPVTTPSVTAEKQPQTSTRKEVASLSNPGVQASASTSGPPSPSVTGSVQTTPGGERKSLGSNPPSADPGKTANKTETASASQPKSTTGAEISPLKTEPLTSRSSPASTPPALLPVGPTAPNTKPPNEMASSSIAVGTIASAPSPLVYEFESALKEGRLIRPAGSNAWDIYQQISRQPGASMEVSQIRSRLADALVRGGKTILAGDLRGDNITDRVEEFRLAGQMFARARTLQPENSEIGTLEKMSAAQALIALQFYDEAERALGQLPRSAISENSLGIIYTGKLEYWKAERAFKNAIDLDPSAAMPHYNLGLLFRLQKNEAALPEFESAARLDTTNYALFLAVGDEYFTQSKWQAAAEAYRKAVVLKPLDDNLHTKLGHALFSQGLRDEANKAYQKAKELRSRQ